MNKLWSDKAWDDYLWWVENDKKTLKRINALIKDIDREPFQGIGKPEPLRFGMTGLWSRRISVEHRIVYSIKDGTIVFYSMKDHYDPR